MVGRLNGSPNRGNGGGGGSGRARIHGRRNVGGGAGRRGGYASRGGDSTQNSRPHPSESTFSSSARWTSGQGRGPNIQSFERPSDYRSRSFSSGQLHQRDHANDFRESSSSANEDIFVRTTSRYASDERRSSDALSKYRNNVRGHEHGDPNQRVRSKSPMRETDEFGRRRNLVNDSHGGTVSDVLHNTSSRSRFPLTRRSPSSLSNGSDNSASRDGVDSLDGGRIRISHRRLSLDHQSDRGIGESAQSIGRGHGPGRGFSSLGRGRGEQYSHFGGRGERGARSSFGHSGGRGRGRVHAISEHESGNYSPFGRGDVRGHYGRGSRMGGRYQTRGRGRGRIYSTSRDDLFSERLPVTPSRNFSHLHSQADRRIDPSFRGYHRREDDFRQCHSARSPSFEEYGEYDREMQQPSINKLQDDLTSRHLLDEAIPEYAGKAASSSGKKFSALNKLDHVVRSPQNNDEERVNDGLGSKITSASQRKENYENCQIAQVDRSPSISSLVLKEEAAEPSLNQMSYDCSGIGCIEISEDASIISSGGLIAENTCNERFARKSGLPGESLGRNATQSPEFDEQTVIKNVHSPMSKSENDSEIVNKRFRNSSPLSTSARPGCYVRRAGIDSSQSQPKSTTPVIEHSDINHTNLSASHDDLRSTEDGEIMSEPSSESTASRTPVGEKCVNVSGDDQEIMRKNSACSPRSLSPQPSEDQIKLSPNYNEDAKDNMSESDSSIEMTENAPGLQRFQSMAPCVEDARDEMKNEVSDGAGFQVDGTIRCPTPSPAPPTKQTVAYIRYVDARSTLDYTRAKYVHACKEHKELVKKLILLESLSVGKDSYGDDLDAYAQQLEQESEEAIRVREDPNQSEFGVSNHLFASDVKIFNDLMSKCKDFLGKE